MILLSLSRTIISHIFGFCILLKKNGVGQNRGAVCMNIRSTDNCTTAIPNLTDLFLTLQP